jgi:succinate dehydrogenase/fumarate reductase flavoprotein subunit
MSTGQRFVTEPARSTPVGDEADVLVIGGGSAGVSAAVAAARAGASVIMVERLGYLGGLASGGLIALLLTLDDGAGRQVIRGLCQEVTDRMARRGAAYFPPASEWGSSDPELVKRAQHWGLLWGHGPHRVRYSVAYDAEEFKFALAQMIEDAKVRPLLHAYACDAIVADGRIAGAAFQGKSGRFAILARVVIDASGDGDIFTSAGCAFEKEKVLPWLWFTMGGIDGADEAIERGSWFFRTIGDGRVLMPWGATDKVARKIDATDPADLTYAEIECRKMVMQQIDRMRDSVAGFSRAHICHIADQLGITESRRLVGEYVLARDDEGKTFDDTVAITGNWTKYGAIYHIPYRSLVAREFPNLLVAGRCISVDHRVHHATKEIPACMASGEAAGTAAALAIKAGVEPRNLDVATLRQRLESTGAIVRL